MGCPHQAATQCTVGPGSDCAALCHHSHHPRLSLADAWPSSLHAQSPQHWLVLAVGHGPRGAPLRSFSPHVHTGTAPWVTAWPPAPSAQASSLLPVAGGGSHRGLWDPHGHSPGWHCALTLPEKLRGLGGQAWVHRDSVLWKQRLV